MQRQNPSHDNSPCVVDGIILPLESPITDFGLSRSILTPCSNHIVNPLSLTIKTHSLSHSKHLTSILPLLPSTDIQSHRATELPFPHPSVTVDSPTCSSPPPSAVTNHSLKPPSPPSHSTFLSAFPLSSGSSDHGYVRAKEGVRACVRGDEARRSSSSVSSMSMSERVRVCIVLAVWFSTENGHLTCLGALVLSSWDSVPCIS
ncbi:hypothetical protein BKA64DRAFT_682419 [Cadophora sp. MPI-SDFR-AT-0126]|nr:hypothetical protein BKA64DRAFT_682419 [Leotiomycetes sp. MPI-SDFR-AT-0126]